MSQGCSFNYASILDTNQSLLKKRPSCQFMYCDLEVFAFQKVKVKVAQSCPTLCDPMDYTLHRLLQARILEWVAMPFSRGSSQPRGQMQVSHFAGGFFTIWANREVLPLWSSSNFVGRGTQFKCFLNLCFPSSNPNKLKINASLFQSSFGFWKFG